MDKQLNDLFDDRLTYTNYRSELCHMRKDRGMGDFVEAIMRSGLIPFHWEHENYLYALYALAMIDYIAWQCNVPLFKGYEEYRHYKIRRLVYPPSIELLDRIENTDENKRKALEECRNSECGRFFLRFNIIERGIDDVI